MLLFSTAGGVAESVNFLHIFQALGLTRCNVPIE
jgi:hypothetical protein